MGGTRDYTKEERTEMARKAERLRAEGLEKQNAFCQQIAAKVLTLIVNDVIRPGPKPEERQCTDVANEITLVEPQVVSAIYEEIFPEGGWPEDSLFRNYDFKRLTPDSV